MLVAGSPVVEWSIKWKRGGTLGVGCNQINTTQALQRSLQKKRKLMPLVVVLDDEYDVVEEV